ncbi:MAG: lipoate--protein ligase family protein [Candidatus Bathycorpusculaceae bacterium]
MLKLETHNAYMNMAIDEAILTARIQNLAPNTIRFYRWKPSAVSIGKFQDIQNEVNIENCRKHGVDIVRRITGGGTVYHDSEGEITYSVIADKKDLKAKDITEVYAKIYSGITEALNILGIKADFNQGNTKTCPNLTVNGKKISGSAQAHKSGVVLQHGTLLLSIDLEKMFTLIRVPWAKTCMEIVNVAKNKITSIRDELGKEITEEEVTKALTEGFKKALNIQLTNGKLTHHEWEHTQKLYKEKYITEKWNFHSE